MTLFDAFRYDGKRVLVVGGATGMGAAAAELVRDAGAEVVVMDFAEVTLPGVRAIHVNLADRASIDAAIEECGGPVDVAVLVCRGRRRHAGHRADQLHRPPPHDRPADRRRDCSAGVRPSGSSRRRPASAGRPIWSEIQELLATPDFDSAVAWVEANGKADYMSTKQVICAYVASQAFPLLQPGHPHQRHLPRTHRHAAGPGQQGHVAGLRRRLPGGDRDRGRPPPWSRPTPSSSCAATPRSPSPGSP